MIMSKYIADKNFYKKTLAIAVPMMIQNGITNFVSLLDNIMVGQLGTAQMSGVAIVNQLLFVFTLCIFGGCSGAGIFTAQYFGNGDHDGVRNTMRFKLLMCAVLLPIGLWFFITFGEKLIMHFLHADGDPEHIALALTNAKQYISIMLVGLVLQSFSQTYVSTLRETGETLLPMKAGALAVLVNLVLNYVFIFDHFGIKGMGVAGAALATTISRIVELGILVSWTHRHTDKNPFAVGLYKSFKLPAPLIGNIVRKGMPLMFNESLWSLGMTMLVQCYSVRGLSVVAAVNIAGVVFNVFSVVFIALGDSVAIIVGQLLGNNQMDEAKDTDTKLIFFSTMLTVAIAVVVIIVAPLFPMMYNTEPQVRTMATSMIRIVGLCMPINAFLHAAYFTIRSGGKTVITFLFDCGYVWCVPVVLAYILSHYTGANILVIYFLCNAADIIKAIVGYVLLKKGIWLNNIVA